MVFSSDIRHPCSFQINRCLVFSLCEELQMQIDEEEFDDWEMVERVSNQMEREIAYALAFYKPFTILSIFEACFTADTIGSS